MCRSGNSALLIERKYHGGEDPHCDAHGYGEHTQVTDGTGGTWLAGAILSLLALIAVIGVFMSRKPPKQ